MILGGGAIAAYYGNKYIKADGAPNLDYINHNKLIIAELADLIIPRTETPGAKDCSVDQYIIYQVNHHLSNKDTNNFIEGIQEIIKTSTIKYNKQFIDLSQTEKYNLLKSFESEASNLKGKMAKIRNKLFGKPFFTTLKELTTIGYCTSLKGSTMGLNYTAIPGKYLAITNYQSGQRSWATK